MFRDINAVKSVIRRAFPSSAVNAWKVVLDGKGYIVTPAHVALFPDKATNKYKRSIFIDDLGRDLDWKIPRLYAPNAFSFDFAWASIPKLVDCLTTATTQCDTFHDVDVFFQTPYYAEGLWDSRTSKLAFLPAALYPSPLSGMFEVHDVGYKSMSGALVTKSITGNLPVALGMLLCSGGPIPFKATSAPTYGPDQVSTSDAKIIMEAIQQLAGTVLTKNDLVGINNVTAMCRSVVMPVSRMIELMGDSVSLDSVVGKVATLSANVHEF